MRAHPLSLFVVLALLAVLAGCSETDSLGMPDPGDIQADVTAGADAVSLAGPSAQASAEMIGDMIELVGATTAAGAASRAVAPNCPSTFVLPSGISGTCNASDTGVVSFAFGGTLGLAGGAVTVEGTFVATPSPNPPATGSAYLVDYDATATGPRGTATWSALGSVLRDEAGQVTSFNLTLVHTLTPSGGGGTVVVTVMLSPTHLELVVSGPRGGVLRFSLDRESMSGAVSLNGQVVAHVSLAGACLAVDFLDALIDDQSICIEG